ncbi:ADP-ribosylation/Crystallin J1, partial [Kipferlia bialata]
EEWQNILSRGDAISEGELEDVAKEYFQWIISRPFDCGNTIRTAFGGAPVMRAAKESSVSMATTMTKSARNSGHSKANGALMRESPLFLFCHSLVGSEYGRRVIHQIAALDCRLSHPNPTCVAASMAYVTAGAALVASAECTADARVELALRVAKEALSVAGGEGWEVKGWLEDAETATNSSEIGAWPMAGYVKHAFTLAFFMVKNKVPFEQAMHDVLILGGDTDTNAAIVGGLLGAFWGQDALPRAWVQTVRTCVPNVGSKVPRDPSVYAPSLLYEYAPILMERSPCHDCLSGSPPEPAKGLHCKKTVCVAEDDAAGLS